MTKRVRTRATRQTAAWLANTKTAPARSRPDGRDENGRMSADVVAADVRVIVLSASFIARRRWSGYSPRENLSTRAIAAAPDFEFGEGALPVDDPEPGVGASEAVPDLFLNARFHISRSIAYLSINQPRSSRTETIRVLVCYLNVRLDAPSPPNSSEFA